MFNPNLSHTTLTLNLLYEIITTYRPEFYVFSPCSMTLFFKFGLIILMIVISLGLLKRRNVYVSHFIAASSIVFPTPHLQTCLEYYHSLW